jgi:hypothetical protein
MYGIENQVAALWNGTYNTEFELIGNQIDQKLGLHPVFGPSFKSKVKILHAT